MDFRNSTSLQQEVAATVDVSSFCYLVLLLLAFYVSFLMLLVFVAVLRM